MDGTLNNEVMSRPQRWANEIHGRLQQKSSTSNDNLHFQMRRRISIRGRVRPVAGGCRCALVILFGDLPW